MDDTAIRGTTKTGRIERVMRRPVRLSMRLRISRVLFLTVSACAASFVAEGAAADIYGYVDEQGVPHFSDVPQNRRFRLVLREPGGAQAPARVATRAVPQQYQTKILSTARDYKLDPKLLHAVIGIESGYDARAVSPKGAMGLMQLMPDTARRYGATDSFDADQNLRAGARYLRDLLQLFSHDLQLTLAAYNAGEGAVIRHGNRIPPYPETQAYVPRVLQRYQALRQDTPENTPAALGATRLQP